ncbi:purple acid phosphatase [Anaeramoeba flamelloides]|uniref:Purple acid phosphatase n=1 Tax=Anaeramoeba flamelloides TaxID=1746091 RepID=A0ABQ8YZF4_9EUKA|nr:purple acid phosphatase [Anaeramoeba flamelloides]
MFLEIETNTKNKELKVKLQSNNEEKDNSNNNNHQTKNSDTHSKTEIELNDLNSFQKSGSVSNEKDIEQNDSEHKKSGFRVTSVQRTPCHLYLSVPKNLSSEMIIIFHTAKELKGKPQVKFGENNSPDYNLNNIGQSYEVSYDNNRWIHYVGLTGLTPNTEYKFIAGDSKDNKNWSKEKNFRTSRSYLTDDQLTFVVGADVNVVDESIEMAKMMSNYDPDFVAIGGDIALSNGNKYCYRKWDQFLDNWHNSAVHNNRLIPIMPVIGNHEVMEGYRYKTEPDTKKAPFFFTLFQQDANIKKDPFDQKPYRVHHISENLAITPLDTHHIYTENEQIDFMNDNYQKLRDDNVKHIIPIYHIPAYPSDKEYSVSSSTRVRTFWTDLFDIYKIKLAFEGHSHLLKKTKPLYGGKAVDQNKGTIFLGDGAWGRLRDSREDGVLRWYEEYISSTR